MIRDNTLAYLADTLNAVCEDVELELVVPSFCVADVILNSIIVPGVLRPEFAEWIRQQIRNFPELEPDVRDRLLALCDEASGSIAPGASPSGPA